MNNEQAQTETTGRDSASGSSIGYLGPVNPDYLARNIDVCKAVGVCSGINATIQRLIRLKRTPGWLIKELDELLIKANCLVRPLADHRDELSPHIKR